MFHSTSLALISQLERLNRYALIKTVCIASVIMTLHFSTCSLKAASDDRSSNSSAVNTLVCDDQINISIPNGTLTITPSMVITLIPNTTENEYTISIIQNGLAIGNQVTCDESGQILEYNVTYKPTGASCSGTLLLEDKSGPELICVDMDIPCSANSSVDALGHPMISDNCDENPTWTHTDNFIDYNCTNVDFLSTIERTFVATDNLGNSNSCVQIINIIRPDISGLVFPEDITISCTDGDITPSNTGGPSIADMLSNTSCNYIVYFEDIATPVCVGTTKIIREWFVTDWCTGDEESNTQVIVVEDAFGPDISCPAELVLSANKTTCDATVNLPIAAATDSCSNVVSVIPRWEFGEGNITYENVPLGTYTVTYTAEDDCGNTSSCTSVVTIIDDVTPVAVCDLVTTVSIGEEQVSMICAEDVDSGSYDNCELNSRAIRLVGDTVYTPCILLNCVQVGQTLNVEMQVTDINGLANTCMVEVNVFDKVPPVITTCAADITISCDEDANDLSITGNAEANDNCDFSINFTDVSNLNECNIGVIIRTFVAADESGNTSTCEQRITLEDNTVPVIQFSEDISVVCVENNAELGKPIVEDNCGKFAFSFNDQFINDNPCIQTFTRTWEVLNICTDEKVSQDVKITLLNDTTLPEFSDAPTDITAACNADIPAFITPNITDECDSELTIAIADTDEAGLCPSTRILTRTYTATDDCGNSSAFVQTIRLIDETAPTFVNFPADQTINCDETILEELPDVIDNCDTNPMVNITNDTLAGTCLNEILVIRTFTVSDFCGNSNTGVQLIRFVDNVAPIIRGQTRDLVIPCGTPIPLFDLGAIDNCDNDLDVIVDDTPTPGDCPQEENITRVFIVIDDCGNEVRDTIQITIVDDIAPTLHPENFEANLTISCEDDLQLIEIEVTDNCDTIIPIIENRDTVGDPCNLTITRTFLATDDCGNASELIQNVTLIDDEPPFFASFPQDQDVTIFAGEIAQVDVIPAQAIDNCTRNPVVNYEVDFFDDGDQAEMPNLIVEGNNDVSGDYPLGIHRVFFDATDDCGNEINRELLISVVNFTPSSECRSTTLEIGENGLLLVSPSTVLRDPDFINDPSISNIRFVNPSNFTQVIGNELLLNCGDLGLTQFAIEIITNDGENSICSNMINLIDPDARCGMGPIQKAAIAGKIFSLTGQPMTNIEINLLQEESKSKYTDQFGVYIFEELPMGTECEVQPIYDNEAAKGVTTFDMVLIMQHILATRPLSNPYQHIAADVDLNGRIDIFDLLEIRSLILFQTEHFSVCPSHTFIEKKYEFSDPNNPLIENIPTVHLCTALDENMIDLDFFMIKMGDIDGTEYNNITSMVEQRTPKSYDLFIEDRILQAGVESEISIKIDKRIDIAALQFSLSTLNAELINYEVPEGLEKNYFQNENHIHFAWTQYDNELSDKIITLRITPTLEGKVSELLTVNQANNSSSFNSEGTASPVYLKAIEQDIELENNIILKQNTPNPFSDFTDIEFYLHKGEGRIFSIHDMTGQLIYQQKDNFNHGWNRLRFTPDQITPGVYLYSIEQGQEIQIKKMVIAR